MNDREHDCPKVIDVTQYPHIDDPDRDRLRSLREAMESWGPIAISSGALFRDFDASAARNMVACHDPRGPARQARETSSDTGGA